MAYGMTSEEYWKGDPYLAVSYREAYKLKEEIKNNDAWWMGLYVFTAVSTVHFNLNRPKGKAAQNYLEKPIDLHPEKKTVEDMRNEAIEQLNMLQEHFAFKESFK